MNIKNLLTSLSLSLMLIPSLQLAANNEEAVKNLAEAIENVDKSKVQELLFVGDFSNTQLQAAKAKAMAVLEENNTYIASFGAFLLSPARLASLAVAGFFGCKTYSTKKLKDGLMPQYEKDKKALRERIDNSVNEIASKQKEIDKLVEARTSKILKIWNGEPTEKENNLVREREELKSNKKNDEKNLGALKSQLDKDTPKISKELKKYSIIAAAAAGTALVLFIMRSTLRDIRAIVAAIDAKLGLEPDQSL